MPSDPATKLIPCIQSDNWVRVRRGSFDQVQDFDYPFATSERPSPNWRADCREGTLIPFDTDERHGHWSEDLDQWKEHDLAALEDRFL